MLEREIISCKLENADYHRIEELAQYKGREIDSIRLVAKREDGTLFDVLFFNDETFGIDGDGHLDYSSYSSGVMHYEEEIGKYVYWRHFHRNVYDFVGYIELYFREEDEEE